MKPSLSCPHARYIDGMRIYCDAAHGLCGNVFYKQCKGWWSLNPNAARCPLRRIQNGADKATDPNCGDGLRHP